MIPNKYQQAVYKHFADDLGHSAVISVAGSGKTVTAIEGIGHIPRHYSILLGAFNTSIRDEFRRRGEERGYKNVRYANFNSFGWGICLKNLKKAPELDAEKTANILEYMILKPQTEEELRTMNLWRNPIKRIVSLMKCLNIHGISEVTRRYEDIVDHYNIDVPDSTEFKQCLFDTYLACLDHHAHYDFDDQKFMPLHLGLPIPKFDYVIVDEFQDTCPVEAALMQEACTQSFCAIGDPDQTIYGFKAADPEIFDRYISEMVARRLPLSICYRCPKAVIREAQKIVPRIEWADGAAEGIVDTINQKKFQALVKGGDFVLCRTVAELVGQCIEFIRAGIKAKVRGRELGSSLEWVINKVGNNLPIADFITGLGELEIQRIEQLRALRRYNEIVTFEDRCKTIRALCDNLSRSSEIAKRAEDIFTDKPHDGVDMMTAHKSKGLQAKNVFIIRPDLLPHPKSSERAWMAAEEQRLKYVAITRAEESLYWVNPK